MWVIHAWSKGQRAWPVYMSRARHDLEQNMKVIGRLLFYLGLKCLSQAETQLLLYYVHK